MFYREAKLLESVKIKGVAKFYEAIDCLDDNPPCSYIVQEYIPGHSLQKMLRAGHRFTVDEVYDIILQTLNILEQLHHHNPPIIHRDIKPSNLMISTDEHKNYQVTIIDFGAVANPQVQSGGSTVAGTFGYMPPEQFMGKAVPASDIYALGAMAIELFTGIPPSELPQKDFHIIFEPEMQSFPIHLVNTLRRMVAPDPEMRLSDYAELKDLFRCFKEQIYKSTKHEDKKLSYHELRDALKNVHNYGQSGNLELWQELSDKLPRQQSEIDLLYFNLSDPKDDIEFFLRRTFYEKPAFKKSQCMYSPKIVKQKSFDEYFDEYLDERFHISLVSFCFRMFLGAIIDFFMISLIISHWSYMVSSDPAAAIMLLITLIFIISISLIPIIQLFIAIKKYLKSNPNNNPYLPEDMHKSSTIKMQYISDLLKNGRKTIATILSVEYITCDPQYIEFNLANAFNSRRTTKYCYHGLPMFKIKYKFNPPDDSTDENLIHTVFTHTEPENHYHEGDPLPILYEIYKYGRFGNHGEFVNSMPFPMPYEDLLLDSMMIKEWKRVKHLPSHFRI